MGDLNADLLKIDTHSDTCEFYELMSSFGFKPLIMQPTRVTSRSATIIDNIFVNDIEARSIGGNITTSIADHFPQFTFLNLFDKTKPSKRVQYGRSYKNFDQTVFDERLKSLNWQDKFEGRDVDYCTSSLIDSVNKILDDLAPIKKLTKKERNLLKRPWITEGILTSIRQRDKMNKLWMKEKDVYKKETIHKQYKLRRNLIITLLRRSKGDYYKTYFEDNKSNCKKTWEGIREIINVSKKSRINPCQIFYKNKEYTDKEGISESFNDFFVNIGNMIEDKIPDGKNKFTDYLNKRNINNLFLYPVDNVEIKSMISVLSTSKACGPNSIPNNILKTSSDIFMEPIKMLINKSFISGSFPNLLKLANVCPIYKKKDKTRCENYRPISLLSNLSKLFERSMHTRMYKFLDDSNSFYELQFGFRKKYSTNHALLSIIEGIRKTLDNTTFSCGVFIDLEKAFDTVNHTILLAKLDHYGLRGIVNSWFKSYLEGRQQHVTIDGVSSQYKNIMCGVPQGSILGPLLFLLYINDMHRAVKHSIIHHFADDTNLLYSNKNLKQLRKRINEDLKLIFNWLCANRLSLNVGKTEFIIFKPKRKSLKERITLKLNGVTLYESPKIKYLGLIMDDRLTWKFHIFELRKKLNKSVGMIYKMRNVCPQRVLLSQK